MKMLPIKAILGTLCQLYGFKWWKNFQNHHPEKLIKISEISKKSICGGVSL